jgi:hypothetical protein
MFYFHNPLSFGGGSGGGATNRLPSLELPFSPAQPCNIGSFVNKEWKVDLSISVQILP